MILHFSTDEKPWLNQVGGKAKALIEMTEKGFHVPAGFVLDVAYFDPWLVDLKSSQAWHDFLDQPNPETCQALQMKASTFSLTSDQEVALQGALKELNTANGLAVRSSSPDEDLTSASFAGGYETSLGVTIDQLELAIKKSFGSMLDYRVVSYKQAHNLPINDPRIAVIVQEQVHADVSGVAFSANPQNKNLEEVMVNASFGLGESIVSGHVTPDIYTVAHQKITSRSIAHKDHLLQVKLGSYMEQVPVRQPDAPCLKDDQVLALHTLAKAVEAAYGYPVDIEWAMESGQLYLLQARPITSDLTQWTWHHGKMTKRTILVRGSIVELMPDPLTPLYADYTKKYVAQTMGEMIKEMVGDGSMLEAMTFPTINGYAYYKMDMSMGFVLSYMKHIRKLLKAFRDHPAFVEEERYPALQAKVDQLKEKVLGQMGSGELYRITHELTHDICRYYTYCQMYLAQAYSNEGLFMRYYNRKLKKKVGQPYHLLLLGDDTVPILADKALYLLAQTIGQDAALRKEVLETDTATLVDYVKSKGNEGQVLHDKLAAHLKTFGHMVYDLDFAKPTPADDPAPVLELLKAYVAGQAESPILRQQRAQSRRQEIQEKVQQVLSPRAYASFKKKLEKVRFLAPFRDDGLANVGYPQPLVRKIFAELGRRLVKAGQLLLPEDIYWLRDQELHDLVEGKQNQSLLTEIVDRKTLWDQQKSIFPPMVLPKKARIFGIPISAFLPKDLEEHEDDQEYEGIGVSVGKVTGRARVILSPEDFGTMKKGEILVTSMTTPAWTPLFSLAAGIVTDVGGPLSHSSIVAREYGIPAVLGTGGLSKIIRTGQTITVDADKGLVIIEGE